MAKVSAGALRILERRLARLAAEAERMLDLIQEREQMHRRMEELGQELDALAVPSSGPQGDGKKTARLRADMEELRRRADKARAAVADWVDRCRQLLLDGARIERKLLPLAERTRGLRLWWERGPEQMQARVLEAQERLLEAIQTLQPEPEPASMAAAMRSAELHGKELLTVQEAAEFLSVSARKLYRMAGLGQVPHLRLGRSLRFRPADLERWLQSQSVYPRRR